MVNGRVKGALATILTGGIIPAKHLIAGEFDHRPGTFHHIIEPNHRRNGEALRNGVNFPATVKDEMRPAAEQQP
jgi:hypothetical protein